MFGLVDRIDQVVIVIAIWSFQLIFSSMWMRVFRFGPCEWVWRTVSYWRLQPMVLRPVPEGAPIAVQSEETRQGPADPMLG
jgi:uncharacterized protein